MAAAERARHGPGRVVLNLGTPAGTGRAGGEAGEAAARLFLRAVGAYSTEGGRVDTRRLRDSAEMAAAEQAVGRLRLVDVAALAGRGGRLAFWINVYNALALHGVLALRLRRSVWEVWNFFGRVSYRVGDLTLSLDDIEHGILRGNRRRPWLPWPPFGRRDPRRALAVEPMDPRVHFAITCGARSCPPVGVYRAERVDAQLEAATRSFVGQEVGLDAAGRLTCSRLFKWYARDFGGAGALGAFLAAHHDDAAVRAALQASGGAPCRRFRPYSWALAHPPLE